MGECFRRRNGKGVDVDVNSVNLTQLRYELEREPNGDDIEQEIESTRLEELSLFEYGIVSAITKFQNMNEGFCRIWGGAIKNRVIVNLSVEFVLFDDDKQGWKDVRAWIKKFHGMENVMDRRTHLDKFKPAGAKRWRTGKHHGRPETQIESVWDITHMGYGEVSRLIAALKAAAQEGKPSLWNKHGNAVI